MQPQNLDKKLSPFLSFPDCTDKDIMNLSELLMDGSFISASKRGKSSMLHSQAIDRRKELIGKSTPLPFINHLPPPQEVPPEEYAIPSPSRSFMALIKSIMSAPSLRKEPPLSSSRPIQSPSSQTIQFSRSMITT